MADKKIRFDCRHFNGYKPCGYSEVCHSDCTHFSKISYELLIIHLGALGAVVRSTSLLQAMKKKYPNSRITWVTDAPAQQLLKNHPDIDRVLTTSQEDLLILSVLKFDVGFVIDKSIKASAVLKTTRVNQVYRFIAKSNGVIVPATDHANELWELGLNNNKKFFINKKPETQLLIEALNLGKYTRDDYYLPLTDLENNLAAQKRSKWQTNDKQPVIGFNTGCAAVIPYKKWTIEYHRKVIQELIAKGYENIVLLGGPEDTERNQKIGLGLPVFQSDTKLGLRDGLTSVAATDIVITGDSLGMHMAISQKKYVIAWFGPTCAHEIELYGRGEALLANVICSPCWKRSCEKSDMCYDQVELQQVIRALKKGEQWLYSTSKQLFLETFV